MHLLRAARPADAQAIVDLTQAAYQENQNTTGLYGYVYEETAEQLIATWNTTPWRTLVLEDQTANIIAAVRVRWDNPQHLWLARLAVSPQHQGYGLGRFLVQAVETMAARWGRKAVFLGALEASPRNRTLYEQLGYEITDRREMRHAPGHFYHVMQKAIPGPITNQTVARYEHIADEYAQRNKQPRPWIYRPIETFCGYLPSNAHVLDLGCGPGQDGALIEERGFRVTFMDATWAMLDLVASPTKVQADSRALPFGDHTFDGVWASATLLHLPHHELVLALLELTRIVKPDGICFISLKQGEGEGWSDNRWFAYYQPELVQRALEGVGWQILEQWINSDHRPTHPPWIVTIARRSNDMPTIQIAELAQEQRR